MNRLQRETLDRIIPATHAPVDREKCKAGLAYARAIGFEPECRAMILEKRLAWLTWWTITQRKWQSHTRNPNKAMHHDSISLREKYVRC
jgi:hypothetical protein